MRLDALFAAGVLSIVAILIVPLPPPVLDVLLGLDIFGAALLLAISLRVEEPLEFSAFAPALLIATLFRLALDVSATRLILSEGHVDGGVGSVVPAFGAFVVRGNLVVGVIVFAILITIQFIVIAAGAQRVAEVSARFTLDAMPGKQMAIDAEVHAGSLDAEGARAKRARIQSEADFYAAMDGAGKFVKGDAIAALVIVALNLVGGVIVGMSAHEMGPLEALDRYAILSIGNALVTTLPAFLISTAMGLMVTRVAGQGALGAGLVLQLLARPDALRIAGGLMAVLALVPALPGPLFGGLALAAFGAAATAGARGARRQAELLAVQEQARRARHRRPENAFALVGVDALSIEFGPELCGLLVPPNGEALLERIGDVRRALAAEIGIVIPGVRLRDDPTREPTGYVIAVRGRTVGSGLLRMGQLLAVAPPAVLAGLPGDPVREPVYGLEAHWVDGEQRDVMQAAGALCFDAISILGSHLSEVVRCHAADIFGRQELHTLVEHLRASVPSLAREIGSESFPLAAVHRAFGYLLRERIWPRDPIAVFEAIVDSGSRGRDARDLAEVARRVLVPAQFRRDAVQRLEPLLLAPAFEAELLHGWQPGLGLSPNPDAAARLRTGVTAYLESRRRDSPLLLVSAPLRPLIAEFFERLGPQIPVYAYGEIPSEVELAPASVLDWPAHSGQTPVTTKLQSISA
jgi:flagellar biosynthesis protein FlhA